MSQFAVCVQPRVRKIGAFATSFGIINSTQQRIDLTRTSVQQNWRETDTERRFLKKKMERRRIFFSITLHVIISSVVQSCCDTSNGWVDITESSRVGDIIGNIQGHSMTSFKNVRVIFVPRLEISSMLLISHLLLINSHNRMSSLLEVWFLSIPRLYSTRGMCIP